MLRQTAASIKPRILRLRDLLSLDLNGQVFHSLRKWLGIGRFPLQPIDRKKDGHLPVKINTIEAIISQEIDKSVSEQLSI